MRESVKGFAQSFSFLSSMNLCITVLCFSIFNLYFLNSYQSNISSPYLLNNLEFHFSFYLFQEKLEKYFNGWLKLIKKKMGKYSFYFSILNINNYPRSFLNLNL